MPTNQSTIIEGQEPSAKLSVIEQLYNKLTQIKDSIKEGSISQSLFDDLTTQGKLLQDKLNILLNKRGILTQSEVNDAYATLQEVRRKELEAMKKKAQNKAIMYVVIFSVVVAGAYMLYKRNKK